VAKGDGNRAGGCAGDTPRHVVERRISADGGGGDPMLRFEGLRGGGATTRSSIYRRFLG
jgi:hypothetical protein